MQRRELLTFLSALGLTGSFSLTGCKEMKTVTAVVPFPPGGGGDVLSRAVLEPMRVALNLPLVIQNKPGSGGNIGTRTVVKARDVNHNIGYVTNGILCVNEYLYGNKDFDTRTDLVPVGAISKIGLMAVINPKAIAGVDDWGTLIAYAKAHPGELAFASSGVGTTSHLAGELLSMTAGVMLNHIPHAGGAAAMTEVLAGRIPLMIDVMPNTIAHVKAGKLKALAVTTPDRSPLAPEVPTMMECGFKGYSLFAWDGLVVPKAADKLWIKRVSLALQRTLNTEAVGARLKKLGAEAFVTTPEEFQTFVEMERPKWRELALGVAATLGK